MFSSYIEPCIKFLQELAKNLEFESHVYHPANPKKPIFVMTWKGTQPELSSILLHSHMDVVPVYEVPIKAFKNPGLLV